MDTLQTRLSYIASNIVDAEQRTQFQRWLRERFGPVLSRLGLTSSGETSNDARRASLTLLLAVTAGDQDVQRRIRDLAERSYSFLNWNLRPTGLQVAAYAGDRALYDRYRAQLPKLTSQPEEFYSSFNALGWFADPELIQETLTFSITAEVRSQDTSTLLRGMLRLPWAREATWKFVKDQWPALTAKLGVFQGIPGIVSGLSNLCSAADAADVRLFFTKNPLEAAERRIQQAIEAIDTCARIDTRQSPALVEWLAQH